MERKKTVKDKVTEYLKENPNATAINTAKALGIKYPTAYSYYREIKKGEKSTSKRKTNRNTPVTPRSTPEKKNTSTTNVDQLHNHVAHLEAQNAELKRKVEVLKTLI